MSLCTQQGAIALYGDVLGAGALVGSHVVDELIGRGGFGAVYRARHAVTSEPVAIKLMHRELGGDRNMVARFGREARAVQRIVHPGVVDIRDVGTLHDGRPYYAMEWLPGRDLASELEGRGALTTAEILDVAEQIGAALAAVHAAGVVHRDIKPANILAIGDGGARRFVLVDFGIARWIDPEPGQTVTAASVLGTPEAMAPEQIRGERVDARTDIYALGVLLFLLATGRLPFPGGDPAEIEDQHLYSPPPRASELAPVPPALDAVLARCLAKHPADRYPGTAALLGDLRAALSDPSPQVIRCVGVQVAALFDDPDRADELLEQAAGALRAAGLSIAIDTGTVLVAAIRGAGAIECDRAIEVARRIADIGLSVRVHTADAIVEAGNFRGGPLFRLADWQASSWIGDRRALASGPTPCGRPARECARPEGSAQ